MKREKKEIKDALMEKTLESIERMTGDRNFIGFPRVFVDYMGSVDGAIFLSQLVYWSDRTVRADGGIYKKYDAWTDEIGLSKYEVQQAVLVLKEKGILDTKLKKAFGAPTLHYYLDKKEFTSSINEFLRIRKNEISNQEKVDIGKPNNSDIDSQESADSLTDTTTETTSEIERQDSNTLCDLSEQEVVDEDGKVVTEDGNDYDSYWLRMERLGDQGISKFPIYLPEDFKPDDNMLFWAYTRCPQKMIGRATEKFIDHFRGNRKKLCNWKLKWKEWIENERTIPRYQWTDEIQEALFLQSIDLGDWLYLFEDFLRMYCLPGLVPAEEFHKGLPHLTESTIDEALRLCSGRPFSGCDEKVIITKGSLVEIDGIYYDSYNYEHTESYRKYIDGELASHELKRQL